MQKWIFSKIALLPVHIVLWTFVWLFYVYFFSYATENERFVLYFATSLLPITMIVTYMIAYYLIPTFLLKKRHVKFTTYLIYIIIGSLFLIIIITFVNFIFLSDFDMKKMPLLTRNFLFIFILVYLVAGIFSFVQLLRYNYKSSSRNSELEKKLLEGQLQLKEKELYYLKEQIHPHFLFNTLNTIYGSALKESKDTPDLILKLSNLLDYTLHQIDKPTVSISEEMKYLESYIGLEQVRFKDSLNVQFSKDIINDVQVPPMLFIAFVENAFKHGGKQDDYLKVQLHCKASRHSISFYCRNTVNDIVNPKGSHGLGIENTRKRLDVLYPNNYKLITHKDKYWFILELNITLTK